MKDVNAPRRKDLVGVGPGAGEIDLTGAIGPIQPDGPANGHVSVVDYGIAAIAERGEEIGLIGSEYRTSRRRPRGEHQKPTHNKHATGSTKREPTGSPILSHESCSN